MNGQDILSGTRNCNYKEDILYVKEDQEIDCACNNKRKYGIEDDIKGVAVDKSV